MWILGNRFGDYRRDEQDDQSPSQRFPCRIQIPELSLSILLSRPGAFNFA